MRDVPKRAWALGMQRRRDSETQLRDVAAKADAAEGIRQGLQDPRAGRVRPAEEFFAEFEQRHGIRRLPE